MKEIQIEAGNKIAHPILYMLLAAGLVFSASASSTAQESPLPGIDTGIANANSRSLTPQPVDSAAYSAPVPGSGQSSQGSTNTLPGVQPVSRLQPNAATAQNFYSLPISITGLQSAVHDLKYGDATEESLNKYLAWLDTLIKAHNKLVVAFAKQEDTSAACHSERNLLKQLCQLKDQVLYLSAQMLIKENRLAEAVTILVDIIAFEPQSPLGQQAYTRLVEAGFSPQPPANKPELTANARPLSHNSPKVTHSKIR